MIRLLWKTLKRAANLVLRLVIEPREVDRRRKTVAYQLGLMHSFYEDNDFNPNREGTDVHRIWKMGYPEAERLAMMLR
ncbi:hypothetical protein [Paraburkholderia fungorum]|uniref:Uncharacterized protein n=1 Tax=Paraburkholderia fungorum TaxID=134537 RepID=A0A3R7IL98_9BURK|nr:hypothetical protein [Paraburkholderia fungorum]RKF43532.1 hypothetical protein BCY88_06000 [Paraburkholderia fungorum]